MLSQKSTQQPHPSSIPKQGKFSQPSCYIKHKLLVLSTLLAGPPTLRVQAIPKAVGLKIKLRDRIHFGISYRDSKSSGNILCRHLHWSLRETTQAMTPWTGCPQAHTTSPWPTLAFIRCEEYRPKIFFVEASVPLRRSTILRQ